jgi:hypothetical protein
LAEKRKHKNEKSEKKFSCFLARGGLQAACQKCQGKNGKGKILNVIIILLGLFVIIYGVIYSYKKTTRSEDLAALLC